MDNLLNLPEVQSAAAPLLVGLILAALCAWKQPRLAGIAVAAGFVTTALLVNGWVFTPLTATRKIILLGAGAGVLGLLFDLLRWRAPARPWGFAIAAAASVIWVSINYLDRRTGTELYLTAGGIIAYVAFIVVSLERMQEDTLRHGVGLLALAIGTGGAATLGASALLGQLAFGTAAGAGAVLLIAVLAARTGIGSAASLGAGLILGLIGCAAVLFASQPWYVLILLAVTPWIARLVPFEHANRFVKSAVLGLATLVPALIAIYLTWKSAPQSLY